ncbi:MAG: glycosyltransferase family 1 protein [Burkholderiales bacterium]|nr:glycosyltransferase family 1 protein [Burkholderiales bacterium]
MTALRIVVAGIIGGMPYAGMAWQAVQIVLGLRRLGHDAWYFETTSAWPYDPLQARRVPESEYAEAYLTRVFTGFDLAGRWAYRRSYSDKTWRGMDGTQAEALLAGADLVLNISGATVFADEGLRIGRLVYYGTDPVYDEINYASGNAMARANVDAHDDVVTFGENIGGPDCTVPPLPRMRGHTRQPVVVELWQGGPPVRREFTTVGNWKQSGRDIAFAGDIYRWSKHHEFHKLIDLPARTTQAIELATNLSSSVDEPDSTVVPTLRMAESEYALLQSRGWGLADGPAISGDPWRYRDYIVASRGEFTVAKDMYVRPRSGWFSDRSACYLAAGRPVVTQDTGFGRVLPTGTGLFAFRTADDVLAAFDAINADYERHSQAAREIADQYFRAETVLARMLADLGC